MKVINAVRALLFCSVGVLSANAQTKPQDTGRLQATLAQMDQVSEHFKSARAELTSDFYQAVVKDTTTEKGPVYFERIGKGTQMGAVFTNAKGAKSKVLEYKDGVLRYYEVQSNQVRTLKAGSNQAQYESFLTLGFGGSGRDLARVWNIADMGQETMTDGGQQVRVEKLELVSKDPEALKMFTHVTIWVDLTRDVSLKQVFDTPSHDRRTATYSQIVTGRKIDDKTFKIPGDAVKLN